jgi:ribosomal protein S18 acetylase RimI-like enzyme
LNAVEIERIYVLKAYQGIKAGQALLEKAFEIASKYHSSVVWLGVWEKNHRAIQFYLKNGFIQFSRHTFRLGNDDQTDSLMHCICKK